MKLGTSVYRLLALLSLCFSATAFAQTDIAGDWRGRLVVDANTTLPVQFLFTKQLDGSYSATLNSIENQFIQNVAASSVSWKEGTLKVEVPELSGSYAGTLKDDHFEGQWSQVGSKAIPLVLSRPPRPSKADLEILTGSWQGALPNPERPTVIFEFKQDAYGGLAGSLAVPQQGALGVAMTNLEVGPGTIAFKIPAVGAEYRGTFSGTSMTGTLKQGPQTSGAPLNMTKTNIAAPRRLGLNGEVWNLLYGNWKGKVGSVESLLHFLTNGMEQVAFIDVPVHQAKDVPITSVTVTGRKIVFEVAMLDGKFSGELADGTITGQWIQGGKSTPATWTKQ